MSSTSTEATFYYCSEHDQQYLWKCSECVQREKEEHLYRELVKHERYRNKTKTWNTSLNNIWNN